MKKKLVGALAVGITLALTGCTHPSTGDGRTWPAEKVTSSPASAEPTVAPSNEPGATPDLSQPSFPVASPSASPTATNLPTPTSNSAASEALSKLDSLTVAEADYAVDYNRTRDFGPAWEDVDGNGCDTRNDILKRDLTNIQFRADDSTCTVASGTLASDPYTGKRIEFTRGARTSSALQIDHVYSLHQAFQHGAANWTQEERERYANDPFILLTVDGPANNIKSDKGPADWMPSSKAYRCPFVEKFVGVAAKYDLTISRRDAAASREVLSSCN